MKLKNISTTGKRETYQNIGQQFQALMENERDFIANASNFSALLFNSLTYINWLGFYILKKGQLVLGPFQGKPACIRIDIGKGVCGTAALNKKTILVEDVHKFKGHIPCDAASKSEIVIPIIHKEKLIGVLDIDSPVTARFDKTDKEELEKLVNLFKSMTDLENVS